MKYYIGLDIGGTKCAATLGVIKNGVLEIIDKGYFLTAGQKPAFILERFFAFIDRQLKHYKISGIGISCGGPLDSAKTYVLN